MKAIIPLLTVGFTTFMLAAADSPTPSFFQLRLVRDSSTADTEQFTFSQLAKDTKRATQEVLHISKLPLLDQSAVRSAFVRTNGFTGGPEITVEFTEEGGKRLAKLTEENVGKRVAIFLEGKLWSAPRIPGPITGGGIAVDGPFTLEEAHRLADKIGRRSK
jgi:preprotein translocase subunit SecD